MIRKHRKTATTNDRKDAAMPATPDRRRRRPDQRKIGAVTSLVRAVDRLDLPGELLADARDQLDRAERVRTEFATARAELADRYDDLLDGVVGGATGPGDALTALLPATVAESQTGHVRGSLAARLEADVVERVEAEAVEAASRDATPVHDALSDKAAEIVGAATEAAATLFDFDGYVKAIEQATQRARWDSDSGCLAGWPRFDLSTVDPLRLGIVGSLRDLTSKFGELHDTARVLAELDRTLASRLYRSPPQREQDKDGRFRPGTPEGSMRWVPPELALAVAARLGWAPGLWRAKAGAAGRSMLPDFDAQAVADQTRAAIASVGDQQYATRIGR